MRRDEFGFAPKLTFGLLVEIRCALIGLGLKQIGAAAMNRFTATVEYSSDWWVGQLEEDAGVIVQARSVEQLRNEFREALRLFPELTAHPATAHIEIAVVGEAGGAGSTS